MGGKVRKIVSEQLLRDPSPFDCAQGQDDSKNMQRQVNRNCPAVSGSETADAILLSVRAEQD